MILNFLVLIILISEQTILGCWWKKEEPKPVRRKPKVRTCEQKMFY